MSAHATDAEAAVEETGAARAPRRDLLARVLAPASARIGAVLVATVLFAVILGPALAPHDPTLTLAVPFKHPSSTYPLGTDVLGRDVLSRFLDGGRAILGVSAAATALAYLIGIPLGLIAGYRRSFADLATVAVADVLLAFPPIILVLVLLALAGSQLWLVAAGLVAVQAPRVVRIVRASATELATLEYVEAAVARGETTRAILRRELLPNLWTPVLADLGVRLTGSIILAASLAFLGFGVRPPGADWGLMISENRIGFSTAPIPVLAPALAIAVLTVGVNLLADSVARALGRTVVRRSV